MMTQKQIDKLLDIARDNAQGIRVGSRVLTPSEKRAIQYPCKNCRGEHHTGLCPIPEEYDGDYRRDSKGSGGCGCKQ